jgi:hypothetical protein
MFAKNSGRVPVRWLPFIDNSFKFDKADKKFLMGWRSKEFPLVFKDTSCVNSAIVSGKVPVKRLLEMSKCFRFF